MVRPPRSALPTKPAVVALVRRSLLEFVLNVCQVWLGVRTRSMTRTGSMTRRRYSSRSTLHSFSYAVGAWGENGDASPGPRMARVLAVQAFPCNFLFRSSSPPVTSHASGSAVPPPAVPFPRNRRGTPAALRNAAEHGGVGCGRGVQAAELRALCRRCVRAVIACFHRACSAPTEPKPVPARLLGNL